MSKEHFQSAEVLKDSSGRQYHLNVAPGEVNKHILLCGDPQRAYRVAKYFDKIDHERTYREYVTISGSYQGLDISVVATGIGCDNTEIAIVELSQCIENPVFLRIGTCGALQAEINLGAIVISTGALRFENTSSWFAPIEYPAIANHQLVSIAEEVISMSGTEYYTGLTATCSGFYGAQERSAGLFKPYETGRLDKLAKLNVLNFEMEASALFVLSSIAKFKAGTICTVYANRQKNVFIDPEQAKQAEDNLIRQGLNIMLKESNTKSG